MAARLLLKMFHFRWNMYTEEQSTDLGSSSVLPEGLWALLRPRKVSHPYTGDKAAVSYLFAEKCSAKFCLCHCGCRAPLCSRGPFIPAHSSGEPEIKNTCDVR